MAATNDLLLGAFQLRDDDGNGLPLELLYPRESPGTKCGYERTMTVKMIRNTTIRDACFSSFSNSKGWNVMAGRKVSGVLHELSSCEITGYVRKVVLETRCRLVHIFGVVNTGYYINTTSQPFCHSLLYTSRLRRDTQKLKWWQACLLSLFWKSDQFLIMVLTSDIKTRIAVVIRRGVQKPQIKFCMLL
jgi:hypothetical protein